MSGLGLVLRRGWLAATVALVVGATTTALIAGASTEYSWVVSRVALFGFIVLAMGTAVGSEQAVGLASAPMLGSALLGVGSSGDPAWGRSILIGCLWYVAVEAALASIEQRDGAQRSAAVGMRRLQEVATVVIIALVLGPTGALASSLAPERSLVVRVLVVSAVLLGLVAATRHLGNTAPPTEYQTGSGPARSTNRSASPT